MTENNIKDSLTSQETFFSADDTAMMRRYFAFTPESFSWPRAVARFYKVSPQQFYEDLQRVRKDIPKPFIAKYHSIRLPERATRDAAGYDFFMPLSIELMPGMEAHFPTGIRCQITPGWFLMLAPRSGLGFKYYLHMANTVGVIDSEYYASDNEGHIMCKMRNDGHDTVLLLEGHRYMQGIFVQHGITDNDNATKKRNGGFGSTGE